MDNLPRPVDPEYDRPEHGEEIGVVDRALEVLRLGHVSVAGHHAVKGGIQLQKTVLTLTAVTVTIGFSDSFLDL